VDYIRFWDIVQAIVYFSIAMKRSPHSSNERLLRSLLKEYRIKAGLTQEDVASAMGQPQSFVSKYESGERLLTFVEVRGVCQALGLPFHRLVNRFLQDEAE
jgi:transcriptional regulator with XRE-family HTH domain